MSAIEARKAIAARALPMVDLTNLNTICDNAAIDDLCTRAQTPFGSVGAICIWPRFVAHAKKQLQGADIPIATVVNFPSSTDSIESTVALTNQAMEDGADEIDLVMPYLEFIDRNEAAARMMITAVRKVTEGKALLKVIIESGELHRPELIRAASHLAISQGTDFIKTSTGKVIVNATPQTADIMIQAIADSGKPVGFKPAGGIKTTEDCGEYLDIADRIMGPGWATPKTFRFGASSVLTDLLAALEGAQSVSGEGY